MKQDSKGKYKATSVKNLFALESQNITIKNERLL